ncbi:hypothetical protein SVAN01_10925 [Stagonosporopsis vannaccii]|nr:hypothetical protein SVAN01_10925 [Stagonosporopsis vannaccii]
MWFLNSWKILWKAASLFNQRRGGFTCHFAYSALVKCSASQAIPAPIEARLISTRTCPTPFSLRRSTARAQEFHPGSPFTSQQSPTPSRLARTRAIKTHRVRLIDLNV